MKSILYLTTTEWGWIKQRPHFIAEGLSKYYPLIVVNSKVFSRKSHVRNRTEVVIKELFRLPFERISIIKLLNSFLLKIQLRKLIRNNDIIWFASLRFFSLLNISTLKGKIVVYDIMDDILEFPEIKKDFNNLSKMKFNEYKLFKRSDLVFTSASFLKNQIAKRYGEGNVYLVNNAIVPMTNNMGKKQLPEKLLSFLSSKRIKLTYIGTLSSWLDMSLLINILDLYSDIEILLFGPSDISLPNHERLKHFGAIEHDCIFEVMNRSDAMIMPFVINDLIKSVNPVKLYEYVYSNKPCISVFYDELTQFTDYVYFYNDIKEFQVLLNKLIKKELKPKADIEKVRTFYSKNTWDNRIEIMREKLDSIIS